VIPTYLAERYLPNFTAGQLLEAAGQAKMATARMRAEGRPVHYLRSIFIPSDETCFCLFEGASEKDIEEANRRAGTPYERIVEVLHVSAHDVG